MLLEYIKRMDNEIRQKIVLSCQESIKAFKEDNRITFKEAIEEEEEETEPYLFGDETHKQMPYTQEASTRTHYKRLARFIRVLDDMMMDARIQLIRNSFDKVRFLIC